MTSMTRGPLPPGVYWRRRLFALGLVAALVVMIAGALRGGSDGSSAADPDGVAEQVAGTPLSTPTAAPTEDPTSASTATPAGRNRPSAAPTPTPMPAPTGTCAEDDILVEPVVEGAVAGSDVTIALELRTRATEACTWEVSSGSLTLKVTSGSDDIWASRQCPRVVPVQDVVIRQDFTTTVDVVWNARRSDEGCTRMTEWALPGYYHVAVAPLGGEPVEVQFRLAAPIPEVITQSPQPDQGQNQGQGKHQGRSKNKGNPERNPGREN
jgi:hypothetical protein